VIEGLGTAILFLAVNFSSGDILVVMTGILTAAVLSGKLTGAHFNSSLTIAFLITEGMPKFKANFKIALVMIVSQFIGGYIGSLYSLLELGED
jgi:glycerol uptake facilitator-like aquaporin